MSSWGIKPRNRKRKRWRRGKELAEKVKASPSVDEARGVGKVESHS